jgi:hypothetical protein
MPVGRVLARLLVAAVTAVGCLTGLSATAHARPATGRHVSAGTAARRFPTLAPAGPLCLSHLSAPVDCLAAPPDANARTAQPASTAGQTWSIVPAPDLAGALRDSLAAVTCPTVTACWAVGARISPSDYSSPLAEHWVSGRWRLAAPPNPAAALNSELLGIACPRANDCWAVGAYSVTGGESYPLVEHWNGSSWSVFAAPRPAGAFSDNLDAVSCPSASDCWAVGGGFISGGEEPTLERWNGSSWTLTQVPMPAGADAGTLQSITCRSQASCWAAGSYGTAGTPSEPLVERWGGRSWSATAAATVSGGQNADLAAIACPSAAVCWAAGSYTLAGVSQSLLEEWTGSGWAVQQGATGAPTAATAFQGLSCPTANRCWASGYTTPAIGSGTAPMVQEWNGSSWTAQSPADPKGAQSADLAGLSCSSSCWAVGSDTVSGNYQQGLVERWTSGAWRAAAAPIPTGTQFNELEGTTCLSASDCWAVGGHTTGAVSDTLTERWDGSAWTVVRSPSDGADDFLQAVSCLSSTDCWAVGLSETSNAQSANTLVEHWNGRSWSLVSSPDVTGAQISVLSGVSCASTSDCWAVGESYTVASSGVSEGLTSTGAVGVAQTLVEQWNGSSWSIVSSADTSPAMNNSLSAVSCLSATDCWAVGVAEGSQDYEGVVEQWNGSTWQLVTTPQTSGAESYGLFGVSCASATACWAVGYSYLGSGSSAHDFQTWVLRWQGSSWTQVTSADPGPDQVDALFAVSCARPGSCWAVGAYGAGPTYETLAETWNGKGWTVGSTANPSSTTGAELLAVSCPAARACWSVGYNGTAANVWQNLTERTAS